MPNPVILRSLHGRAFGLGHNNELIVDQRGRAMAEDSQVLVLSKARVSIPAAQVQTLFTTPRTLVAAPGAGLAIVPWRVAVYKAAGTAYAGVAVGEDLSINYTNGSGARPIASIETTGFLDQTTAQTRIAYAVSGSGTTPADFNPTANAALVVSLLVGDITTGDSALVFHVDYEVIPTVLTL